MGKRKIGILIIFVGIIIVLYPILSDVLFAHNHSVAISQYKEKQNEMTEEEKQKRKDETKKYNQELIKQDDIQVQSEDNENDGVSYINLLNVGEVLGYVQVPKIDVNLPIYHGISKNVLESGVGHMPKTSLPTGELGSHCVLAAHSGLVRAKLFDDIDQLVIGDIFYISRLDELYTYKVDQIKIVKPEETKYIEIEECQDYVTLLTCVPYGINSHRLLIRGSRTEYVEYVEEFEQVTSTQDSLIQQDAVMKNNRLVKIFQKVLYIVIFIIIILLIIMYILKYFGIEINIFKKKASENIGEGELSSSHVKIEIDDRRNVTKEKNKKDNFKKEKVKKEKHIKNNPKEEKIRKDNLLKSFSKKHRKTRMLKDIEKRK